MSEVAASDRRWIAVRVQAPTEEHERIAEALFALGAGGVQEERGVLITHFPPGSAEHEVRDAVRSASADATVEFAPSPNVDWSEAWKQGLHRHQLGTLTVTPPWLSDGYPAETTVVIEPGTGFGTGEHPTTRSVIRLMQRVMTPGAIVADLGSGSGILSIAAAKLGAGRVIAIEMDEDSNRNAAENIGLNGVAEVVTLLPGDATLLLPLVAPVDVVLANIISSVLLPLMPIIKESLRTRAPDATKLTQDAGRRTQEVLQSGDEGSNELRQHAAPSTQPAVILAGLLSTEREMMLGRLADWRVMAEDTEGDWWSVLLSPT